ncbi:8889_t:CDS:2 [Cetraspora pellucida]|uniref:8889_t:CDS:1 n=1 Tax=Cetraspora pellucida TaxID=1433469 RepID=A0A9N9NYH4_9GLOM|nr:8889_t:CDS:2 [Cetraspora pellucida]
MLPPPPEVHNSADELFQNAQRFANSQGYTLVKKRTRKDNRGELKNMSICCDQGDHLKLCNATHNYDPSNDMSGHPIVHRLTEEQKESIAIMTTSGSHLCEIISTLQQNDLSMLVISSDIYNMRAQLRQQNLAVTHLFFAHKESVSLSHQYPTVILMDCEEEDDYKWALTNVISIFDRMQKPSVIVTDRELALMNTLKIIFPNSTNLLCVWHISKNILKNCKLQFSKETNEEESGELQSFFAKWNDIVQSETKSEFDVKWNNLCSTYINKPSVISYLQETWIPWKEKFIKSWTNQLLHLDTTVTSRIEGSHATLKAYLQTSTGDLHHIYTTISLAVTNQKKEFNTMIASECIHISAFATYNSLYSNIRKPLPSCTGTFTIMLGLPCAHFIQHLENNQNLMLNDIHKHWWIPGNILMLQIEENSSDPENPLQPLLHDLQQRYQEWPEFQQLVAQDTLKNLIDEPSMTLQNPNVVYTRGHPSGAPNHQKNNTTCRDPSGFEIVEHKNRHCAICQQSGHNAYTCTNKK